MVHVEEVEKIQYLIEANPISLDIFRTGCILLDQCAEDRKDGEENEERNSEFNRTEKFKEYSKESLFFSAGLDIQFLHMAVIN